MARPSSSRLTAAYLAHQAERVIASVYRIVGKQLPSGQGRVIPEADDLTLHEGRRLDATVLFLDICKFSSRPSETSEEQETVLQTLALFFTEMIRIIQDHGGVVEKNTGDGLMAYFVNNPFGDGTVQQRALASAITMFSAADRLINPILLQGGIPPIGFRVCLDHGPITIARLGAARGFNGIVAVGTTANLAAKMLAGADANTIVFGDSMLAWIPTGWRQFVRLKHAETGWIYRADGRPYRFWEYQGRWTTPAK